jgi:hypothetical protein
VSNEQPAGNVAVGNGLETRCWLCRVLCHIAMSSLAPSGHWPAPAAQPPGERLSTQLGACL